EEPLRAGVLPVELALRPSFTLEHRVRDLKRLLEELEPLAERWEREAQRAGLLLVPGRADPEPRSTTGQHVERRRGLDPESRVAVVDAADHQPEASPGRVGGKEPKGGPALEHRLIDLADTPDLEEMVHHPDRIEPDIIRLTSNAGEGRTDRFGPAGPRERRDLDADLHSLRSVPNARSVARYEVP